MLTQSKDATTKNTKTPTEGAPKAYFLLLSSGSGDLSAALSKGNRRSRAFTVQYTHSFVVVSVHFHVAFYATSEGKGPTPPTRLLRTLNSPLPTLDFYYFTANVQSVA